MITSDNKILCYVNDDELYKIQKTINESIGHSSRNRMISEKSTGTVQGFMKCILLHIMKDKKKIYIFHILVWNVIHQLNAAINK